MNAGLIEGETAEVSDLLRPLRFVTPEFHFSSHTQALITATPFLNPVINSNPLKLDIHSKSKEFLVEMS